MHNVNHNKVLTSFLHTALLFSAGTTKFWFVLAVCTDSASSDPHNHHILPASLNLFVIHETVNVNVCCIRQIADRLYNCQAYLG